MLGEATPGNAAAVLREATRRFGASAAMPAGNGSRFAGRRGRKKDDKKARKESWQSTMSQKDLPERRTVLINGPLSRPQTSGKLERFFETGEAEIAHR